MDDTFLHSLRSEPSPEFAHRLRARLRHQASQPSLGFGFLRLRGPALRTAVAVTFVAAFGLLLALPSVRVSAQAFLDLFRVVNFAAVPFESSRLDRLKLQSFDLPRLLGEQIEVKSPPARSLTFPTPQAAAAAAGMSIQLPAWVPVGWSIERVMVSGEHTVRVTADTSKLKLVLDALNIHDLEVPDGLDGQYVTVQVHPIVMVDYRNPAWADRKVALIQSRSPVVALPAGLDLPMLGEIGLRILGMDRAEAHQLAQSTDWRTTLIVPVPMDLASFRQVDVQGRPGLMIETTGVDGRGKRRVNGAMLLWSSAERVFTLQGHVRREELLEMAQTVR